MIKKLQKLKAKKGFTLVELIVVIAIIGVLAAILIPTMLGYVTSSRVTSANSTAASIYKEVNTWLTDMDGKGCGMKKGTGTALQLVVNISFNSSNANGCAVMDGAGGVGTTLADAYTTATIWNEKTTVCATGADLQANFEKKLGDLFPDASASAIIYLEGGTCKGVVYTADNDAGTLAATDLPTGENMYFSDNDGSWQTNGWTNGTNGIGQDGSIYGTNPVAENLVA